MALRGQAARHGGSWRGKTACSLAAPAAAANGSVLRSFAGSRQRDSCRSSRYPAA